ncbi:MAG TPA: substrate-binding domain-containing protein [Vicinamibacterales bacterium]|nr:substrate-binding domain-containing protein [Vicinamibacterales bacterium]
MSAKPGFLRDAPPAAGEVATRTARTLLLVVLLLLPAGRARADDIVVMTSGAFTAAYLELSEQFARATGHRFVTATTTMGVGRESIPSRLAAGEPADVVIVAADALDALIRDRRVVPRGRVDLAKSSIALAVRSGTPVPDISSVEALKRTLLQAKSVAYSASVSGDYLASSLFPRLGIGDEMKAKSQRIERERVGAVVARGDAELGFQQVSELQPIPGIHIVGLLPPDVQLVTVFSGGLARQASHPEAAQAFLAFLAAPAAQAVIVKSGLEPVTHQ